MDSSSGTAIIAQATGILNTGDTAWVLISSALVLLMTPGLALFYGGLVPSRSAINTMNMSFICLAVIPIVWTVIGYSLAFSSGNAIVGNLDYFMLKGIDSSIAPGNTVPKYAPMVFQMMFAIVSPALISGAFVGRIKFKAYVLFIILWSLFVYSFVAHWVWSPSGFLHKMGAIDFAGGTVVHIDAGFSALVAATMLSPKSKKNRVKGELPHNVPFVILGGSLLWFGWFGFNAGSADAANGLAALAFTTTALATAASVFAWMLLGWFRGQPVTAVGSAVAVVVGLVAITPAAGYVSPMSAIAIGVIAATICFNAIAYKNKFIRGLEDPLDVFICHGISGLSGTLLVGLFANSAVNPQGPNGLLFGNPALLWDQFSAVSIVIVYCMLGTWIILLLLKRFMSIEPTEQDIERGIDVLEHGESAYEEMDSMIHKLSDSKHTLEEANNQLTIEVLERKKAEEKVAAVSGQLVVAARRAGMTDIATSVLHNIGNVLNSINTSLTVIREKLSNSEMKNLNQFNELLKKHENSLEDFLFKDPQGMHVIKYFFMLSELWQADEELFVKEIGSLEKNVQHISSIINMQQSLSGAIGMTEEISVSEIINDSLALDKTTCEKFGIEVIQDIKPLKKIIADRVQVLQILVNLIKNSIESLIESSVDSKKLVIRLCEVDEENFMIQISDNGQGILPENIIKIFSHGFTTKKTGHGFGLHNSALTAKEMGGDLSATSEGKGKGATFTLILPYQKTVNVKDSEHVDF